MARLTTPGIWLPGPLNTINSSSSTAQADIAGNPFFMGLNPGKLVVLSTQEAQNVAAAGTLVSGSTLYDGSYQYVQLDSGATAAYALAGSPAFILLDQGAARRNVAGDGLSVCRLLPRQMWRTTLGLKSLFCGVFINPSTVNGASTAPTPGNWTMIFAGGGRVAVNVGSVANVAVGNFVFPDTNNAREVRGVVNGQHRGWKTGHRGERRHQRQSGCGLLLGHHPEVHHVVRSFYVARCWSNTSDSWSTADIRGDVLESPRCFRLRKLPDGRRCDQSAELRVQLVHLAACRRRLAERQLPRRASGAQQRIHAVAVGLVRDVYRASGGSECQPFRGDGEAGSYRAVSDRAVSPFGRGRDAFARFFLERRWHSSTCPARSRIWFRRWAASALASSSTAHSRSCRTPACGLFSWPQGSFSTPPITTAGTMTCTLGSNQVTGDAVASAAWLALPFYWRATTQQFRAQGYSVYSVIALDSTNPDRRGAHARPELH